MRILRYLPNRIRVPLLVAACFLSGLGCGGPEKIVSVKGKVTHKDQPVAGIVVSFVPQAVTITGTSSGQTDENGEYKLTVANTGKSGAVVGTHKVWVSLPRKPPESFDKDDKARTKGQKKKGTPATDKPPPDLAAVLKKYGKLEKTPLTVEVTGDGPIDLKLD
jgi:hypothetical protein